MYRPEDFNIKNAPKEMVQFVLDNVKDFENRYLDALRSIGNGRYPLRLSAPTLYDDIQKAMAEWAIDQSNFTDEEFEDLDIEEIFG